jgi:hypothetical protein
MATTKVPNNLIDLSGDSGALPWAAGTTAQRPGSPNSGDFRFNTDDSVFEFYNGTEWRKINSFNPYEINYLMLAGGAGGGSTRGDAAGGGGAGGALTSYTSNRDADIAPLSSLTFSSGTTYTITIGGGGAGGPFDVDAYGINGDDTVMSGSDITTLTAVGGGGGGTRGNQRTGGNGGSGGGCGGGSAGNNGGIATAGQGFNGGSQQNQGSSGTGGGGTQSAGAANYPSYIPPLGGNGLESSITGTANYYGGGGGGGQGGGTGLGGNGGGGDGGPTNTSGTNGTPNTGGGGGGQGRRYQSGNYKVGGNGGSGVFILSVPTPIYSGTITGSPTVTTNGGNTILTYTGSGTYTH